jgi:hypothetical protein
MDETRSTRRTKNAPEIRLKNKKSANASGLYIGKR